MHKIINRIRNIFKKDKNNSAEEAINFEYIPLISDQGKGKVAVLEYYQQMRELYAKYLLKNGYAYFITGDENEFLAAIEGCSVIILDDHQPEIKGFQLASKLKTEDFNLPVIICTDNANLEAYEEFKCSRADTYLMKPISEEEFIGCVKKAMSEAGQKPVEIENKPAKRGRKPHTFLDIVEKRQKAFLESGLSKPEFAKKNKISISSLKSEFRINALPFEVKKLIRENPDCFKKSFFDHLCKLNEHGLIEICSEIVEKGHQGFYFDLMAIKTRVNEYLLSEKKIEK